MRCGERGESHRLGRRRDGVLPVLARDEPLDGRRVVRSAARRAARGSQRRRGRARPTRFASSRTAGAPRCCSPTASCSATKISRPRFEPSSTRSTSASYRRSRRSTSPLSSSRRLALIGDARGRGVGAPTAATRCRRRSSRVLDERAARSAGISAYVEALVADANGDAFTAQHRYRDALRAVPRRRARCAARSLAALRLADLNADSGRVALRRHARHPRCRPSRGFACALRASPRIVTTRSSRR